MANTTGVWTIVQVETKPVHSLGAFRKLLSHLNDLIRNDDHVLYERKDRRQKVRLINLNKIYF